MPNSPTHRTHKPFARNPPAAVDAAREPRGARRKRETRSRLLEAALKLMAEKGMEGVAINEITEAADVGFGSFYNHFESKEAIYTALVDSVFEEFGDALDRLVNNLPDPAEVIAVSVRHTLLRARREPLWGRFLIREGFSTRVLGRGLGVRLLRDVEKGIASKRFFVADPMVSFISVGGTVLSSIVIDLQFASSSGSPVGPLKELGFSSDSLPERVAAALLQTLGLGRAEAEKIARRPLPIGELGTLADGSDVPPIPKPVRSAQSGASRRKRSGRRAAPG